MRSVLALAAMLAPASGIIIKVDYRYDTQGFFDDPAARAVMEAAAARWSRVIDQSLLPVDIGDEPFFDRRFRFTHPGTGQDHDVSAAASASSDFYVTRGGQSPADEYTGGFTLDKDVWILYVGARDLDNAALGSAISGFGNLTLIYSEVDGFLNRGFNDEENVGVNSLPVLGGVVTFDIDRNWNFNLALTESPGAFDLYSVALHEIGHGLGLNSRSIVEFLGLIEGDQFVGPNALAAFGEDNGTTITGLSIEMPSSSDYHWQDDVHRSKIFPLGTPVYFGTEGRGVLQELLMEPTLSFLGTAKRLEITNVDVGALKDIGWSVVSGPIPSVEELPIKVMRMETGVAVEVETVVGSTYSIQTSPDGESWVNVFPSVDGDGNPFVWSEGQQGFIDCFPASFLTGKYYRVFEKDN